MNAIVYNWWKLNRYGGSESSVSKPKRYLVSWEPNSNGVSYSIYLSKEKCFCDNPPLLTKYLKSSNFWFRNRGFNGETSGSLQKFDWHFKLMNHYNKFERWNKLFIAKVWFTFETNEPLQQIWRKERVFVIYTLIYVFQNFNFTERFYLIFLADEQRFVVNSWWTLTSLFYWYVMREKCYIEILVILKLSKDFGM